MSIPAVVMHKSRRDPVSLNDNGTPNQEVLPTTGAEEEVNTSWEQARQIGLIPADEFNLFYKPLINKIALYDNLLGGIDTEKNYLETIYAGLRKRRSAVFNPSSSEDNQRATPLWTYALFSCLSIRHLIHNLSQFEFTTSANISVSPCLCTLEELNELDVKPKSASGRHLSNSRYPVGVLNQSIIERVIPSPMIMTMNRYGIYAFLADGVTGLFHSSCNPFFRIILEVENHARGETGLIALDKLFKETISVVMKMVASDSITKNAVPSLVFETEQGLLLNRHLFWELFQVYAVIEKPLFDKKEFEDMLARLFDLPELRLMQSKYSVELPANHPQAVTAKKSVMLMDSILIPYDRIPEYPILNRDTVSLVGVNTVVEAGAFGEWVNQPRQKSDMAERNKLSEELGLEGEMKHSDETTGPASAESDEASRLTVKRIFDR